LPILSRESIAQNASAVDISTVAKALLAGKGFNSAALRHARLLNASERAVSMIKSPLPAITSGTDAGEAIGDWEIAGRSWLRGLASTSIFFALFAEPAARRMPFHAKYGLMAASAVGTIVAEGHPTPVTSLEVSTGGLQPFKASAIVVVSSEVAEDATQEAMSAVNWALRQGVVSAVDRFFWDLVIDTATPSTSGSGNDLDAMRQDVKFLIDATNATGAPLLFATDPASANAAAILDPNGTMTPQGGTLFGVPVLVSSNIPSGVMRAVDASSIALAAGNVEIAVARQADLQMDTAPTNVSTVPTGTSLVSLWQSNASAIKAQVDFSAERLRTDAVAQVTNIGWTAP
jgi:hypothetical protein